MKKNVLRIAALSIAAAFVLIFVPACKKSSVEPQPQPPSKTQLISKGAWKIAKIEEKNGSAPWVDITSNIDACEIDNNLVLRSDLSYELNEGITKCDANDPQVVETGTWKFDSNETKMNFTATGSINVDVVEIVELTDLHLVLNRTYNNNGSVFQYKIKYSH